MCSYKVRETRNALSCAFFVPSMGEKIFLMSLDDNPEGLISRLRAAGHDAGAGGDDGPGGVWFIPSGDYSHMNNWQTMIERHFKCSFLPSVPSAGQG